jgi:hypothetical protein
MRLGRGVVWEASTAVIARTTADTTIHLFQLFTARNRFNFSGAIAITGHPRNAKEQLQGTSRKPVKTIERSQFPSPAFPH